MLWPSTRATWKPNVTMSVAYTAADASVFSHATTSSAIRAMPTPSDCDMRTPSAFGGTPTSPPAIAGTGSATTIGSGATSGSAAGVGGTAAYSGCGIGEGT